ncbi:hypothetical protein JQX13_38105 [Archangium violaceum]|uniref:hypothetical protein n=1 Tax=Archangium violaceum TaxID=83451 RepID=UPI00193B588D|nr:hypothetical protein [Archangium violaceum]QRK05910.1 hypothetical protein JQX13_38105 [Archangium violaceum]
MATSKPLGEDTMKMVHSRSSLLVVLALLLSSCSSSTAEVTVQLRSGASSASIAKVEVEVSAPGEDPETTTLSGKTSPWTGSMDALPEGTDRTFTARALDSAGTRSSRTWSWASAAAG